MNRQVPTLGKLLTMVVFALSCFGLTLFLWLQFGGAVPFKAEGYRITATFPEATSLATEADVRIAGVAIGRVKKVIPGPNGRAIATLEIRRDFAPLPVDTKAILRQKTLLGETYVSLTPPLKRSGKVIPEGGRIPDNDIGSTVELDELFATFDPATRKYFQEWVQNAGEGLNGKGQDLGKSFVELQLLVGNLQKITKTLNDQIPYLRTGLRDGKTVLASATQQRGALQSAITQSERVFRQTGEQSSALTAFVNKLPKFLTATKAGSQAIEQFANQTGPTVTRLEPTAKALGPATKALKDVAPELRRLLEGVDRVNANAKDGLPATQKALAALPTLLDGLDPFFKQLNPITEYASLYGDEIMGSIANLAAASNANANDTVRNHTNINTRAIRAQVVLEANSLTASSTRFSTDQANAYRRPGWAALIGQGLADAYSAQSCGTTVPRIPDSTTTNGFLDQPESAGKTSATALTGLPDVTGLDAIRYSVFNPFGYYYDQPTSTTPSQDPAPTTPQGAPRTCTVQAPFSLAAGRLTTYPQLPEAPTSTARSVTGN